MGSGYKENYSINDWSLVYHGYDPEYEKLTETLCAIGNGYLGSRGALERSLLLLLARHALLEGAGEGRGGVAG